MSDNSSSSSIMDKSLSFVVNNAKSFMHGLNKYDYIVASSIIAFSASTLYLYKHINTMETQRQLILDVHQEIYDNHSPTPQQDNDTATLLSQFAIFLKSANRISIRQLSNDPDTIFALLYIIDMRHNRIFNQFVAHRLPASKIQAANFFSAEDLVTDMALEILNTLLPQIKSHNLPYTEILRVISRHIPHVSMTMLVAISKLIMTSDISYACQFSLYGGLSVFDYFIQRLPPTYQHYNLLVHTARRMALVTYYSADTLINATESKSLNSTRLMKIDWKLVQKYNNYQFQINAIWYKMKDSIFDRWFEFSMDILGCCLGYYNYKWVLASHISFKATKMVTSLFARVLPFRYQYLLESLAEYGNIHIMVRMLPFKSICYYFFVHTLQFCVDYHGARDIIKIDLYNHRALKDLYLKKPNTFRDSSPINNNLFNKFERSLGF